MGIRVGLTLHVSTMHQPVNCVDGIVLTTVTTPIGHQDEDVPKEGDLPLHSNDNQEPPRVFDPTTKQLSANIVLLMHKGGKVVPQGEGICISEGLPRCL